jgi:hypothetical protein
MLCVLQCVNVHDGLLPPNKHALYSIQVASDIASESQHGTLYTSIVYTSRFNQQQELSGHAQLCNKSCIQHLAPATRVTAATCGLVLGVHTSSNQHIQPLITRCHTCVVERSASSYV